MNSRTLKRGLSALGISLAVAVSAIAPASFAQPGNSPYPQAQVQPGPSYGQNSPYDTHARSNRGDRGENRADRRLADLHQRLGITPAQEPAWTEFAATMREVADHDRNLARERDRDHAPMNAVQRLELRQHMMERRSADLDRMLHALRPLYASFSDDQKRIADQLLMRAPERPDFAGREGPRNQGPRPGF